MLYIQKQVTGDVGHYFAEVHWDRQINKLHILIYDRDPERTIFGIPIKVSPIIERKFQLIEKESDVDNKEAAMKHIIYLVKEWELPLLQKQSLEEWDGNIHNDDPNDFFIPPPKEKIDGPPKIFIMGERVQ